MVHILLNKTDFLPPLEAINYQQFFLGWRFMNPFPLAS